MYLQLTNEKKVVQLPVLLPNKTNFIKYTYLLKKKKRHETISPILIFFSSLESLNSF